MSTEPHDYPEDEFDVAGRDRGPQGAHRTPRPMWRTLLPFIVVLIAAPLLAWGLVSMIGGGDEPAPQATTQEPTEEPAQEEPTEEEPTEEPAQEEPTEEPTGEEEPAEEQAAEDEEPEPEDEPQGQVDFSATVAVLNGAGISGLAAEVAQTLNAEGFAQVGASNYGAAAPTTTTLYYNNPGLAATAQAVGDAVGIGNLQEAPGATENVDIAIVLRSDYTG